MLTLKKQHSSFRNYNFHYLVNSQSILIKNCQVKYIKSIEKFLVTKISESDIKKLEILTSNIKRENSLKMEISTNIQCNSDNFLQKSVDSALLIFNKEKEEISQDDVECARDAAILLNIIGIQMNLETKKTKLMVRLKQIRLLHDINKSCEIILSDDDDTNDVL
jgi:hypothetical protein